MSAPGPLPHRRGRPWAKSGEVLVAGPLPSLSGEGPGWARRPCASGNAASGSVSPVPATDVHPGKDWNEELFGGLAAVAVMAGGLSLAPPAQAVARARCADVHPAAHRLRPVHQPDPRSVRRRVRPAHRAARLRQPGRQEDQARRLPDQAQVPGLGIPGHQLVNPGGPGGSGLTLSVLRRYVPNDAGDAYDWIGFDPRGVGSSKPALLLRHRLRRLQPALVRADQRRSSRRPGCSRARAYAQAVRQAGGALLDHMKTTDSVRDMDTIRTALGQQADQLLRLLVRHLSRPGLRHAAPRPGAPRGAGRQRRPAQGLVAGQPATRTSPSTRNIKICFDWLAKYDSVYHLGNDRRAVERSYYRMLEQLRPHPAPAARSARTSGPTSSVRPATTSTAGPSGATRSRLRSTSNDVAAASRTCTTTRRAGRAPTTATRSTAPCSAPTSSGRPAGTPCATRAGTSTPRRRS